MYSAFQNINVVLNQINQRLVTVESKLNDPVATTAPVTNDRSLAPPLASEPSINIVAVSKSIEDNVKASLAKDFSGAAKLDESFIEKKIKDEVKREVAKEKVMLETHILHQVELTLAKLLNEKLESRIATLKNDLKAEQTSSIELQGSLVGMDDIEIVLGDSMSVVSGVSEPAKKRTTKKK